MLYSVSTFDPTEEHTFGFKWTGPQAFGNRLVIYDITERNTDSAYAEQLIYDSGMVRSLEMYSVLQANVLTKNRRYSAQVVVYDRNYNESQPSDPVYFWAYGTPDFFFMHDGAYLPTETSIKVTNSSVTLSIYYKQTSNLALNSYRVDMYDSTGQRLVQGSATYLGDYKGYGDINYSGSLEVTLRGLEDRRVYYVQAVGETEYGMVITTPRLRLDVVYLKPAEFSLIEVENQSCEGQIAIRSNLQAISGYCSQDPPRYIEKQRIDLTSYGAYVRFDQGFSLDGDFAIYLQGYNFLQYQDFLEIKNGDYLIKLKNMRGWYDDKGRERAYVMLKVYNGITNYELYSNFFDVPGFNDLFYIWLRRTGSLYDLECCVVPTGETITMPRSFDVRFTEEEQETLDYEGYYNIEDCRLEF